MARRHLVVAGTVVTVALPLLSFGTAASAAPSGSQPLKGSAPTWVSGAHQVGAPSASQVLSLRLTLAPSDAAGAAALADAVSDPTSASYGRYLSPDQYRDRFGPTADTVGRVRSFLSSAGLHVDSVSAGRDAVTASGTVATVQHALGTTLHLYSHNGRSVRAPEGDVALPASLAGLVTAVSGLSDTAGAIHPQTVGPESPIKTPTTGTPCSAYYGEHHVTLPADTKAFESTSPWFGGETSYPTNVCGYTPSQMRTTYGLGEINSNDGAGQKVAIIDAYALSSMFADANTYSSHYGLPPLTSSTYQESLPATFTDQALCGPDGWAGEEALDVDAVHSMAPGAGIVYVGTSSCQDSAFLDAYSRILTGTGNGPLANVVSNSYGDQGEEIEPDVRTAEHSYFVQGATEGVGFYFSSGDSGDETSNGLTAQPDASANDPAVTAVGGTSLGVNQDGSRQFETGWGNERTVLVQDKRTKVTSWADSSWSFYAGAGGGTSTVFAEPSYQRGVVPAALARDRQTGRRVGRVVPDIAADADPYTGFVSGYSAPTRRGPVYSEGDIGGTSLAAPLVAGFMAVANQQHGTSLGFVNPLLYSSGVRSTLHDVLPGSTLTADQRGVVFYSAGASATRLIAFDQDSSYFTASGYDRVTGLGTPNAGFLQALVASSAR